MEYTPISQLKHPFGSPFNSINISLAAVNRKTQLEREREREKKKRSECFTTICLTLLKLEDLKPKLREFPLPKHPPIPGNAVFFAIPKRLCIRRLLGFEGGWTNNLNSCWLFIGGTWWTCHGHNFTTPFTDSKPMIPRSFFIGDFGIPSASISSPENPPRHDDLKSSCLLIPGLFNVSKEHLSLSFLMSRKRSTGILNTSLLYLQGERKLDLSCCWRLKMVGHDWKLGKKNKIMAWKCVILCLFITFFGSTSYTDLREKKKVNRSPQKG